jgi:hypothetical protein
VLVPAQATVGRCERQHETGIAAGQTLADLQLVAEAADFAGMAGERGHVADQAAAGGRTADTAPLRPQALRDVADAAVARPGPQCAQRARPGPRRRAF